MPGFSAAPSIPSAAMTGPAPPEASHAYEAAEEVPRQSSDQPLIMAVIPSGAVTAAPDPMKTPHLQSNMFKMQRNRSKKIYQYFIFINSHLNRK